MKTAIKIIIALLTVAAMAKLFVDRSYADTIYVIPGGTVGGI